MLSNDETIQIVAYIEVCITTGIRAFAECLTLCRVHFIGHSANQALPSAALGKVLLSVKSSFTECGTLGTERHSSKTDLPSGNTRQRLRSAKGLQRPSKADGRQPLPRAGTRQKGFFAECHISGTRQIRSLPSVFFGHSAKHIFIVFNFGYQTFCGMFLHYVDLHVSFWDNSNSVFNS
jgi:hypothetical protein